MDTVGVRELKTHLSRHLKRVRAGSRLLVTERGRAIATINPVEPTNTAPRDRVGQANGGGGPRAVVRGQTQGSPRSIPCVRSGHGGDRPRGPAVILYLDTSSLVKIYVAEQGSKDVQALVAQATVVATSRVAYPEMRAAFARRRGTARYPPVIVLRPDEHSRRTGRCTSPSM